MPARGNGPSFSFPMNPPLPHAHEIQYFGEPELPLRNGFPAAPLRLMIITSIRDVLGDDRNGQMIDTPRGPRYMEGAAERLIRETREGGALADILRVSCIVTDDTPKDARRLGIPLVPTSGRPWIHPLDLRDDRDRLVTRDGFTHWIPSNFRSLDPAATQERARFKEEFERHVLTLAEQKNVDLLLSDHLMLRAQRLVAGIRGEFGRALNIHPAVTKADHPYCFTGKSPTKDAIDHAKTHGFACTGATLHVMDEKIDHGPLVAFSAGTEVRPDHDPMELRYDNYRRAKLPVLIAGLRHYIRHVLPHLAELDLYSLSPLNDVSAPALV